MTRALFQCLQHRNHSFKHGNFGIVGMPVSPGLQYWRRVLPTTTNKSARECKQKATALKITLFYHLRTPCGNKRASRVALSAHCLFCSFDTPRSPLFYRCCYYPSLISSPSVVNIIVTFFALYTLPYACASRLAAHAAHDSTVS